MSDSMLLDAPRLWMESLCAAINAQETAPCSECGGNLICTKVERYEDWAESGTGDAVIWAMEVYRCEDCQRRACRKIELDRETKAERDQERENAIKRSEFVREETRGFLGWVRESSAKVEANRMWPRREMPDLKQRYIESRSEGEAGA